jgi:hypothetical protein
MTRLIRADGDGRFTTSADVRSTKASRTDHGRGQDRGVSGHRHRTDPRQALPFSVAPVFRLID